MRSSVWAASALPGNLRAMWTGVRRGMRSITPEGTSLSARMKEADWIARCVATVRSDGAPGPEPARIICGFGTGAGVEMEGIETSLEAKRRNEFEASELYVRNNVSISASVMEASRPKGQYSHI